MNLNVTRRDQNLEEIHIPLRQSMRHEIIISRLGVSKNPPHFLRHLRQFSVLRDPLQEECQ